MKRIALSIITLFVSIVCYGATFNQYWYVGDDVYVQTTCTTGADIILPTPPTKYGYDFIGWEQLPIQRIEYLESTGTQYIDTGYSAPKGYKAHIKFIVTGKSSINMGIIGSHNSSKPWGRNNLFIYSSDLRIGAGGDYPITDLCPISLNNIIELTFSNFVDDISVANHNIGSGSDIQSNRSANNLWLFGYSGYDKATKLEGKIYFVQFYNNNDILVRDFIPVLDGNGTPCMYDKVEGKYYYNAGTGDFIAGPVITE